MLERIVPANHIIVPVSNRRVKLGKDTFCAAYSTLMTIIRINPLAANIFRTRINFIVLFFLLIKYT